MRKGDIVIGAVAVSFFSFMFIQAVRLHEIKRFGEMGSGFWPMIALGVATLLSLILLVHNVLRYMGGWKKGREKAKIASEVSSDLRAGRKKFALSVLCLLGYIVVMPWIGFILSTPFFVLAFILALEERRKAVLLISPLLVTAVVILVFARFISIPFPRGVGFFATLSRFFY